MNVYNCSRLPCIAFGLTYRSVVWLTTIALFLPRLAPAQDVAKLHITNDRERRELLLQLGPVDLPAHMSHHGATEPPAQAVALPIDGWLHGFDVDLVDGRGRAVPQRVLHHVNLIAPEKRELFSQIMLRIGALGPETTPVKLPRLLGLRVHPGDSLLVTAMLHNPDAREYQGVRLRIHLPYTPSDAWPSPISIYPLYMDVMPPAGVHAYDLPPGRSQKSWEGRPAVGGRLLGVGGHLHQYGIELRFEDVTTGDIIWRAKPRVDSAGNVVAMPTKQFFWRLGIRLHPDHIYRLTAMYNNPTGRAIPDGAMGALGGVFLPDRSETWPAGDLRNPEYRLDLKVTYESMGREEHEHHAPGGGGG
jgi:hypothetical protein